MTQASVCSGIGGAEIAAEWSGWENVFHCEKNDFSRKVLDYYWPKSISYEDLTTTDFRLWRGKVDVFTSGFPCQPFSTAGKRKGTEDDRHLWPHVIRAIREIQPRYVVGENVRGFTNWNGGLVFDQVLSDLENAGYEVAPLLLPACGVNAPHRRDRIWIVAYSNNKGRNPGFGEVQEKNGEIPEWYKNSKSGDASNGDVADTNSTGFQTERTEQQSTRFEQYGELGGDVTDAVGERLQGFFHESIETRQPIPEKRLSFNSTNSWGNNWYNFPTQPPVCGGNDGFSSAVDLDSIFKQLGIDHPRQPTIGFAKWRNESIKALGNAWVPEVAYQIFKVINQMELINQ